MQAHAVAERVIAADGHHVIDAEPFEIFQDFGGEIIFFGVELALEMFGNVGSAGATGIGTRRMEKGSTGTAGAVDDVFRKDLKIFGVVVGFVADHFDQAAPAMAEADDLIAFAERAKRDPADRGIEAGNVAASGENTDDAFLGVDVSHLCAFTREAFLCGVEQTILHEWR